MPSFILKKIKFICKNYWLNYTSIIVTRVSGNMSSQISVYRDLLNSVGAQMKSCSKEWTRRTELINCIKFRLIPIWTTPNIARNSSKSKLSFTFINWCRFSMDPNFGKFCVEIIFIDHQTCQKPCRSTCWSFSSLHVAGVHFSMSSFNLVIDEGDRSVSCNVQQYSKYGYITHHRLCCLHAKYYHTQLGYMVVMSIWIVDAQQRHSYLTCAKSCYIMSVSP